MKYYGTKNNKDYGFYLENFQNAIEISDEYWKELLYKESKEGKIIIPFENSVIAVDETEYSFENSKWRKLSEDETKIKRTKQKNYKKKQEINQQLEDLDKKRIRAIAEPSMKDEEISWLDYYNNQIKLLRDELKNLIY